ncbi:helix-turn-helix transcriptional regulator [Streptomyces sp. NPDC057900]|uniref:helix-turn-helix transcriptional regulator n=1 Tax=Streptomyces sp. NPDC057900 TaxID=3346274 RepID=UPI0036E4EE43
MDDPIRHPLAYARELRGWSQSDLAARLDRVARRRGLRSGTDKTAISRWENGRKKPGPDSQILIAEAFGVPVTEMELYGWPDWLPGRDLPMPLGTAHTVHVLRDAQKAAMDRRSFMTYSAAALAGLAAQWATIETDRLTAALSGRTAVLLPKARDKTRGIFLTYQAKGFLRSNDIEQALAVTTESLDLATRIGAERCVTLVRELAPAFKPYRQVEGVADFIDRLRSR